MGTLADSGKISLQVVVEEIHRLESSWKIGDLTAKNFVKLHLGELESKFDPFDLVQLENVLQICSASQNLSDAGRRLFSVSRLKKSSINDADRLKKYIQRFGLDVKDVVGINSKI